MITIKTEKEIEIMKEGGKLLAKIMKQLSDKVALGVSTRDLDSLAERLILEVGGKPSFKDYGGFPATLCTSVNSEVVHGIPSDYVLKDGDIISLDLGMEFKGFHTDMAVTIPVGEVDSEVRRMIKAAKKALKRGISSCNNFHTFGDVSNTMGRYIESQDFGIVYELCGHGIGRNLHEDPQILNYGKRGKGDKIKVGMVFCLEPMITIGDPSVKLGEDGFVYETTDNSLSAHFEHTIAVTSKGPIVLTEDLD
jgi:methionyl aminopeptidase